MSILEIAKRTLELSEKAQDTEDGKCKECNFDYRGYRHWNGCSDPQNEYKKFRLNNCEKLAKAVILMRENLQVEQGMNCYCSQDDTKPFTCGICKLVAAVDALTKEDKGNE